MVFLNNQRLALQECYVCKLGAHRALNPNCCWSDPDPRRVQSNADLGFQPPNDAFTTSETFVALDVVR